MTVHIPILLKPIVDSLLEPFHKLPAQSEGHWVVDCTLGGGGHTAALLEALDNESLRQHRVLSFDRDADAVKRASWRFRHAISEGRIEIIHACFSQLPEKIQGKKILGLLADLGFSSDQIEDPMRGLSFNSQGPLDMRLDPQSGESAYELLLNVGEEELANLIFEYGEERYSRRIASAVVQARREKKLVNEARAFADLVVRSIPPVGRHGRIHAATRTFQALRIAVNSELDELKSLLQNGIEVIAPGGRAALMSFHSLEDRLVKQRFKDRESHWVQLTKKPVIADDEEVRSNPRSRSAKLRVAERK